MTASRHLTSSLKLMSSGAALLLSSAAFFVAPPARAIVAPTCEPGCMPGYHCEAQAAVACPDIACAPGTNCTSTCTNTVYYGCVPNPCTDDRDCSGGTVCVSETSGCTAPAGPMPLPCPPGTDCKTPPADLIPPGACEPVVTKSCKPKWELDCKTAADCGPGFTCEQQVSCGCSGSAPSSGGSADPAPSGAAAPLPPAMGGTSGIGGGTGTAGGVGAGGGTSITPPPSCSCTPSGISRCQLTLQTCNFNSDCPAGLVCKAAAVPTRTDPGNDTDSAGSPGAGGAGTAGSGAAGLAGAPNPGGAAEEPLPGPAPQPELFCVPPNWSYGIPGGAGGSVGGGGETGAPVPRPGGGPSAGTGGTTGVGGGTTGTGAANGEAPPTAPGGKGASEGDRVEGGCQLGANGSASSGYGFLAALGLVGLLRRRARRAV